MRRLLACLTVLLAAGSAIWLATRFVDALKPRPLKSAESATFDISELQAGQYLEAAWQGWPVLIYRRSEAELLKLGSGAWQRRLADSRTRNQGQVALPNVEKFVDWQSDFVRDWHRSRDKEYLVVMQMGPMSGCVLFVYPTGDTPMTPSGWRAEFGYFEDPCRGLAYDLSGRVFNNGLKDELTKVNLMIPYYSIDAETGTVTVMTRESAADLRMLN